MFNANAVFGDVVDRAVLYEPLADMLPPRASTEIRFSVAVPFFRLTFPVKLSKVMPSKSIFFMSVCKERSKSSGTTKTPVEVVSVSSCASACSLEEDVVKNSLRSSKDDVSERLPDRVSPVIK